MDLDRYSEQGQENCRSRYRARQRALHRIGAAHKAELARVLAGTDRNGVSESGAMQRALRVMARRYPNQFRKFRAEELAKEPDYVPIYDMSGSSR